MFANISYLDFLGIAVVSAFIVFAAACIIDFYRPPVIRRYKINTGKLAKGQYLKILLLSDLHSHIFGENQNKLVNLIVDEEPDIITLAGDIADDKNPIKGTELLLKGIKDIAPTYYVTGNHEFRSGKIDKIKRLFRKYHVKVLAHQYVEIKVRESSFVIGGVDDPAIIKHKNPKFNWEKKMNKAFVELQQNDVYKILLSHRPERVKAYKDTCFDLVLSGHAHGGQVRIPYLLNGLLAPGQGLFPKYAGGLYKHGNLTQVVSRGVSYHALRPRIFNPPEVVVIQIISSKD